MFTTKCRFVLLEPVFLENCAHRRSCHNLAHGAGPLGLHPGVPDSRRQGNRPEEHQGLPGTILRSQDLVQLPRSDTAARWCPSTIAVFWEMRSLLSLPFLRS